MSKPRSVFFLRHGERVDYAFKDWISQSFDQMGNYTQKNLNMPKTLPKRPYLQFTSDSPLTRTGIFQAQLTGEGFKDSHLDFTQVYCSPALRCVQTCNAFLEGCKQTHIKIKLEPGIYEYTKLLPSGLPKLLTNEELKEYGYNVDLEYEPYLPWRKLEDPTLEEYFSRSFLTAKSILEANETDSVLFVTHAGNFEGCVRGLIGKKIRGTEALNEIIPKIPYCFLLQLSQTGSGWEGVDQPFLGLTHTANRDFDVQTLID